MIDFILKNQMEFPVLHRPQSVDMSNYLTGRGTKTELLKPVISEEKKTPVGILCPFFFS